MEIWIIRDGEKVGPLHDFEIRRKITAGELPPDTPAWHEGMGAWKPLVEINIFTREFDQASPPEEPKQPVLDEAPTVDEAKSPSFPVHPGCRGASRRAGWTSHSTPASGGSGCGRRARISRPR